jgi:hypothetical protein
MDPRFRRFTESSSMRRFSTIERAPVPVNHLLVVMRGSVPSSRHDRYVAGPITTAYGKLLLCEFDYRGKPMPTLPWVDTLAERCDTWLLKLLWIPLALLERDAARARRALPWRANHS